MQHLIKRFRGVQKCTTNFATFANEVLGCFLKVNKVKSCIYMISDLRQSSAGIVSIKSAFHRTLGYDSIILVFRVKSAIQRT